MYCMNKLIMAAPPQHPWSFVEFSLRNPLPNIDLHVKKCVKLRLDNMESCFGRT